GRRWGCAAHAVAGPQQAAGFAGAARGGALFGMPLCHNIAGPPDDAAGRAPSIIPFAVERS
ncbi:hypothetical protein, partial [Bordetella pertussis]|uniref:hypothetical protein n=1 Tax=Bordetella pertussis TaxID=520 RepID=UPI001ADD999B